MACHVSPSTGVVLAFIQCLSLGLCCDGVQALMKSHIQSLNLESRLASAARAEALSLLSCEPLNLSRLEVSACPLGPGASLTGSVDEDRVYVLLRGAMRISQLGDDIRTEPGSMLFQPAQTDCKIACSGDVPALLLAVKLMGPRQKRPAPWLPLASASPSEAIAQQGMDLEGKTLAFDGATSGLKRLHCFFLTMEAGDIVPVHQHRDHGVLMLGLSGEIEVDGDRLDSPSLMYYRGGEPHGFEVLGDGGFRGLAIEFYREPPLSEKLRSLARNAKSALRP